MKNDRRFEIRLQIIAVTIVGIMGIMLIVDSIINPHAFVL